METAVFVITITIQTLVFLQIVGIPLSSINVNGVSSDIGE